MPLKTESSLPAGEACLFAPRKARFAKAAGTSVSGPQKILSYRSYPVSQKQQIL